MKIGNYIISDWIETDYSYVKIVNCIYSGEWRGDIIISKSNNYDTGAHHIISSSKFICYSY